MSQDYAGQYLRGRSFKGQDLSGANFSRADIRSADFRGANLTGANFNYAKAGLTDVWKSVLQAAIFALNLLSGGLALLLDILVTHPTFALTRALSTAGAIATPSIIFLQMVDLGSGRMLNEELTVLNKKYGFARPVRNIQQHICIWFADLTDRGASRIGACIGAGC
jgi:uncharacterized protein YjbI with pentapeptide repeats